MSHVAALAGIGVWAFIIVAGVVRGFRDASLRASLDTTDRREPL